MKNFTKIIFVIGLSLALNLSFIAYADILSDISDTGTEQDEQAAEESTKEDAEENTAEDSKPDTAGDSDKQEAVASAFVQTEFSDIAGHWAESRIKEAVKTGFVSGYQDGTFKPDRTITRVEFATLLNKAMKIERTAKIGLSDVKEGDWFYEQVQKSVASGFFSGYENNTFRPNNPITRQEAAKVISSAITSANLDGDGAKSLKDYNLIQDWAKASVNTAYNKSYIMGYPDKLYKPSKELTRAEAVKIIYEILDNENIEHGFNITNYNETYSCAVVVGDLNILDSVGSGKIYITNVTVLGNINVLANNVESVVLTDVRARDIVVNGNGNPVKIVFNDNINIENANLPTYASIEKIGSNIQIKNSSVK